ncbi:hypothetical protein H6S82_24365 [Planktothrix sp. FACHB-1355]|uniref:Sulfotransferase domain-containing protein n=1 Tax=Aerosakkonema funiforme FACHB-1375 TaxID=2949571 RepID=A0A926VNS2_9CYAN|nr:MULTISPECIES: hypothetical protein [Oscillatoriales]MBD2185864.1 hypothetical protein [Aerosakkonema funiforme FACHB-1375]MBD3561956.1 hypothetical protein [Planktothrix sp. FACHB-1355]
MTSFNMYDLGALEKNLFQQKFEVRSFLSLHPKLFFPLVKLAGKNPSQAVGKHTELVIEGFPRSANSFSIGAFQSAQPRRIALASHLHAPAQIIRAAHLNIPTLVLIRKPVDAVVSLRCLELETNYLSTSRNPALDIPLEKYFSNWISFYTRIMPYRDRYVVGLFDEVTHDFGSIIEKINYRFGTNFTIFYHTKQNVDKVHKEQGFHSGPSKKRQFLKQIVRQELESDEIKFMINKANAVYYQFEIFAGKYFF